MCVCVPAFSCTKILHTIPGVCRLYFREGEREREGNNTVEVAEYVKYSPLVYPKNKSESFFFILFGFGNFLSLYFSRASFAGF